MGLILGVIFGLVRSVEGAGLFSPNQGGGLFRPLDLSAFDGSFASLRLTATSGVSFSVATSVLMVDGTNQRIGVGTSTPTSTVHIVAPATTTLRIGGPTGCLVLADSDGAGVSYITALDGELAATSTKPAICQ